MCQVSTCSLCVYTHKSVRFVPFKAGVVVPFLAPDCFLDCAGSSTWSSK